MPAPAEGASGRPKTSVCGYEPVIPKLLWMDEIHFAPLQRPKDDSPVNTNQEWFSMVSKWCRILSIRSKSSGREVGIRVPTAICSLF